MGLILNNALYRGTSEAAGEIGYMIPDREMLKNAYPEFGPLEYLVAGVGLAKQAREVLKGKIPDEELEHINAEDVFNAYRNNEEWAFPIVDNFIVYLSMAIIATCAMFDPEIVIIGGGISKASDVFMDRVRENLKGKLPNLPEISISDLKTKAAVLGATIKLLHNTSNYYIVHELS